MMYLICRGLILKSESLSPFALFRVPMLGLLSIIDLQPFIHALSPSATLATQVVSFTGHWFRSHLNRSPKHACFRMHCIRQGEFKCSNSKLRSSTGSE